MNKGFSLDEALKEIHNRHFFDDDKDPINPYKSKRKAQTKCTHMWSNETDAIFVGPHGRKKCAICGKEF